jgi:serine/threonine protein kinase
MDTFKWNSYTIHKSLLGKGSYAKVYYGIHNETKREIAMKKMSFSKLQNEIKDKVIQEIHILQRLNHPNVMKLYEYKFDGEYLVLITEYCQDRDLEHWLKKEHTHLETMDVLLQISSGMEYLHRQSIVHRDIKPANILVHKGVIKICDFGFATVIKEQQDLFRTICGTPLYMSPELLFSKPYTVKSDIWALGILFYTLLYRCHPFGKLIHLEDYRSKILTDIVFPVDLLPIIKLMLNKVPEKRPSVGEIIRSLEGREFEPEEKEEKFEFEIEIERLEKNRIIELEEHIFHLETQLKDKEKSSYLCCLDGDTKSGRNYMDLEKMDPDYFTPPKGILIPKTRPSSASSNSSGSITSSFGTFFNFLTKSFSK